MREVGEMHEMACDRADDLEAVVEDLAAALNEARPYVQACTVGACACVCEGEPCRCGADRDVGVLRRIDAALNALRHSGKVTP